MAKRSIGLGVACDDSAHLVELHWGDERLPVKFAHVDGDRFLNAKFVGVATLGQMAVLFWMGFELIEAVLTFANHVV